MSIKHLCVGYGGIKGISYLGCLNYLHKNGLLNNIETYSGSSIGALIITFISIGYTPDELFKIFCIDLKKFTKLKLKNIISDYGANNCNDIDRLLRILINKKYNENITFKNLHEKTNKKITISGTNLNTCSGEIYNFEVTPDMKIIDALNITYRIPFIFEPCIYQDKYYVDGAILEPLPLEMDIEDDSGLCIYSKLCNNNINNIYDYTHSVLFCLFNNNINTTINNNNHYKYFNMCIDVNSFEISLDQKKEFYLDGYNKMKEYYLNNYKD